MNNFIIKDVDITLLSLLCLDDVFNLCQVNTYFKLLCDEVLHNQIMNANWKAEHIRWTTLAVELTIPKKHKLKQYQKLILLFIEKGSYNLPKYCSNYIITHLYLIKNGNNYHLSIFYNNFDEDDIIYANFDTNGIRNFLRHALFDGLITLNIFTEI